MSHITALQVEKLISEPVKITATGILNAWYWQTYTASSPQIQLLRLDVLEYLDRALEQEGQIYFTER